MRGALVEVRQSAYGGGRGVFAIDSVQAGSLLMHEEPFFSVSGFVDPSEPVHAQMAKKILLDKLTDKEIFAELHPQSLSPETETEAEKQLGHVATKILSDTRLTGLSRREALRCLLVCQFNAFHSGLYGAQSMINHSCRPNCVKLTFEGSSASFVFATEPIEANCEIFVSYLGAEYSHLYRATTLREQHWFEIEGSDDLLPETARTVFEIERQLDDGVSLTDCVVLLHRLQLLVPVLHESLSRVQTELVRLVMSQNQMTVEWSLLALEACCALAKRREVLFPHSVVLGDADLAEDTETLLGFLLAKDPKALYKKFEMFPNYAKASSAEFNAKKRKMQIRKLFEGN